MHWRTRHRRLGACLARTLHEKVGGAGDDDQDDDGDNPVTAIGRTLAHDVEPSAKTDTTGPGAAGMVHSSTRRRGRDRGSQPPPDAVPAASPCRSFCPWLGLS